MILGEKRTGSNVKSGSTRPGNVTTTLRTNRDYASRGARCESSLYERTADSRAIKMRVLNVKSMSPSASNNSERRFRQTQPVSTTHEGTQSRSNLFSHRE